MVEIKRDLEKRLAALEENAKPRVISTLADLVMWDAGHKDDGEEVELSPELQALVEEACKEDER